MTERFLIDAMDAQVHAETKLAEQNFRNAFDAGDGTAMANAAEEIAEAAAKAVHLEERKRLATSQLQPAADPVEVMAIHCSPRSAEWVRSHPEQVRDPRRRDRLTAAHYSAVADGHTPDSDNYFRYVEQFVGLKDGGSARRTSRSHKEIKHPDGSTLLRLAPGEEVPDGAMRLSKREVETAESLGLTLEEYCRRRLITDHAPEWNWRKPD